MGYLGTRPNKFCASIQDSRTVNVEDAEKEMETLQEEIRQNIKLNQMKDLSIPELDISLVDDANVTLLYYFRSELKCVELWFACPQYFKYHSKPSIYTNGLA